MSDISRRELLVSGAAAATLGFAQDKLTGKRMDRPSLPTLLRLPDLVRAFDGENREIPLSSSASGWQGKDALVDFTVDKGIVSVRFAGKGVSRIQVRWKGGFPAGSKYLGDHWERSYADLEWRGDCPNRPMPWYFMAFDGEKTHGCGVLTGAGAMCFWMADAEGISLWADIRSGGLPVELGERTLDVAQVVFRSGKEGETPFAATRAFCKVMCPKPLLPSKPVYGTNDWNYAYGKNSAELIYSVAQDISELSPNPDNRPFSVIDEGWAMGPYAGKFGFGPWVGNPNFGDMAVVAEKLKGMGVRPGIWIRPLTPLPNTPESWLLSRDKTYLDPTVPEVKEHVQGEIKKLSGWGYELIKHDFTTWDLFGRWGFQMDANPTKDGWKLHDQARTNAEVISDLYQRIREAAGSAYLIGCNTVGHLAAGTHEIQRIGDDTSGITWNRNRRMGVNTLAFRAAQHRTFFEADPDIVSATEAIPWSLTEQWLRLVSQSGTSLFVAVQPGYMKAEQKKAVLSALDIASKPQPVGEPLDWLSSICPRRWRLLGKEVDFNWMGESGGWPFPD